MPRLDQQAAERKAKEIIGGFGSGVRWNVRESIARDVATALLAQDCESFAAGIKSAIATVSANDRLTEEESFKIALAIRQAAIRDCLSHPSS